MTITLVLSATFARLKAAASSIELETFSAFAPIEVACSTKLTKKGSETVGQSEIKLLKLMSNFPTMMETALDTLEPQIIANYLQELASSFHKFYGNCKVITEDKNISQARLGLINGTKIILSTGLSILGISAPEKM